MEINLDCALPTIRGQITLKSHLPSARFKIIFMAVYTEISTSEAGELLRQLGLGQLTKLEGCSGGIENTNYFATSDVSEHVLTVFERLSFEQLPYYLHLMKHLAAKGIPVPDPSADAVGNILHSLQGKPACVVNKLRGKSELAPTPAHCGQVGDMLAKMHLAGKDYERMQPNLRGLPWWNETVPVVLPFLTEAQRNLIISELAYQNHIAAGSAYAALPRGPIMRTCSETTLCLKRATMVHNFLGFLTSTLRATTLGCLI